MLKELIGQKIVAIKALKIDRPKKKNADYVSSDMNLVPVYILLSDKKTYLCLEEQDYSYHDCSPCAKDIETHVDKVKWKAIMDNVDGCYPDANTPWWG